MASGLLVNAKLSVTNFAREIHFIAKLGCVVLSLFYALSFVFDPLKPLGITPGNLIPPNFWIWTIATHQLIEINIFYLLINFAVLIVSCNILEPLWGMIGFLTFFAVTTVLSGVVTGSLYLLCYVITFDISYLFDVHIYGFAAYTGGFLVALKQCRGDTMIIGSMGLNVKDLPLVYSCTSLLLTVVGVLGTGNFVLSVIGIVVSWIYLRYYQSHSRGRGDSADNFAFKTFFPKPLDSPVGVVGNALFQMLLKLKICRKTSYRYDVGAPNKITITLSGIEALDAERRRNKAIKALDERLQQSQSEEKDSEEWPELHDVKQEEAQAKSGDDTVSTSSLSSKSDIVRIDVEPSSPSDENMSH